jgi:hypothetical protein
MNAAVVKAYGSCEHSIPSTVENMTGFAWCTKRQKVGGNMEAVFHNPDWQRECAAFSAVANAGRLIQAVPASDKDALLLSTGSLTTSIPIVIPSVHDPVQPKQPTRPMTKKTQNPDLFADIFM